MLSEAQESRPQHINSGLLLSISSIIRKKSIILFNLIRYSDPKPFGRKTRTLRYATLIARSTSIFNNDLFYRNVISYCVI